MPNADNKSSDNEPRWVAISLGAVVAVVVAFVVLASMQRYWVNAWFEPDAPKDLSAYGISGDFFGFANAVFSALAFAILIVTLWMQRHELKMQRRELSITQDVMRQQEKEMHDQNESLRRQTFENTFFGLLSLHNEIVARTSLHDHNATGRQALDELVSRLWNIDLPITVDLETILHAELSGLNDPAGKLDSLDLAYAEWYEAYDYVVGHYFRTLYNILKYVKNRGGQDELMYAALVRSQLSGPEIELLLFTGLSEHGREKMKPLIERYSMLKHLPNKPALEPWRKHYAESAFVDPDG
jgi:uncharacterized membrane protein